MCTVVCEWEAGAPVRLLALRDELTSRPFDPPGEWWPEQPGVVGGRDQVAGGSWCVTDVAAGVTALVLNRTERRTGTPSRGVLPLAAVRAGEAWPRDVEVADMAAFTLLLAGPSGVQAWTWDARQLVRRDLAPGRHMITTAGVDSGDPRTTEFAPRLRADTWRDMLATCAPSASPQALVVRHDVPADAATGFAGGVYATVFGQDVTSAPGHLAITWSRTPWEPDRWTAQRWGSGALGPPP